MDTSGFIMTNVQFPNDTPTYERPFRAISVSQNVTARDADFTVYHSWTLLDVWSPYLKFVLFVHINMAKEPRTSLYI